MLTIHQARAPGQIEPQSRTGLAIAGGGPVGAIYELGTLHALDESINGLKLHELDVYVGVSSGALIAAGLANRISTAELCRIFLNKEYASLKFQPEHFLQPAYREYFDRASRLPGILTDTLLGLIRSPGRSMVSQLLSELGKAVPSGIFNNEALHDFLEEAFRLTGHSNQFADLDCQLNIVAVDLDSGSAVRFGSNSHHNVTISRAVQASAALPGLYPPVEIDGHFYVDGALRRTLHASVALDEGVDFLIGVNPLVPFDAGEKGLNDELSDKRLTEGGLPLILSQTFRAMIQSRMKVGFQKYFSDHPAADLVLMEPDRDDEKIFFTNVFSYGDRKALCEHAYQACRQDLLSRSALLGPILERRGMSLNLDLLSDKNRKLDTSIGEGRTSHAAVARKLHDILNDLDDLFETKIAV